MADCKPGCSHPGFTHDDFVAHLQELCPCGHTYIQHPAGNCGRCDCQLFGMRTEANERFAAFMDWKFGGCVGPPPVDSRPTDLAITNLCPECVRRAEAV